MDDIEEKKLDNKINVLKFMLYSFIGVLMFFIPIELGDNKTIPIDHIINAVKGLPYYNYII